jgi:glycosyltransferase involved in cell wall biosynthesis
VNVSLVIISKDERDLGQTLDALAVHGSDHHCEIVVVDASSGRLADIAATHQEVRWIDFVPPRDDKAITIPEQRNAGIAAAGGEVVVFVDAGCLPGEGWLDALLEPIARGDELVTVGGRYGSQDGRYLLCPSEAGYVRDAPTLNMAIHRSAFDRVGTFDERFSYGSDVDFCWRAADAGIPILMVTGADMRADWGSARRQVRRAWQYGDARARLYVKHRSRVAEMPRHDPMLVAYPLYLLGLPLALRFRRYLLLLAIPVWRHRGDRPLLMLADRFAYGAGALAHLVRRGR